MFRRMLTWLVCVGCIIVWSMPVKAVQKGTIKVKTTGGTVALYKIGQINGQSFCLYPEYGGGNLSENDILSSNLAAWLSEEAANGHIKATDIGGNVAFENLDAGLYLIAQPSTPSGQTPFEPFLVAIPWDGYVWQVDVDLKQLPLTGESPLPLYAMTGMILSMIGIGLCMSYKKRFFT